MNIKEKDLVKKAKGLVDSVGEKVASGYWLADGSTPGAFPDIIKGVGQFISGNGVYLVFSKSGQYYAITDDNLTAWKRYTNPAGGGCEFCFGGGVFLAHDIGRLNVKTSANGVSWTDVTPDSSYDNNPTHCVFAFGEFWIFSFNIGPDYPIIKYNPQTNAWSKVSPTGLSGNNVSYVLFDDKTQNFVLYEAVDDDAYRSSDGVSWEKITNLATYNPYGMWADAGYLMVAQYRGSSSMGFQLIDILTGDYGRFYSGFSISSYSSVMLAKLSEGLFWVLNAKRNDYTLFLLDLSKSSATRLYEFETYKSDDETQRYFIGKIGDLGVAFLAGDTWYTYIQTQWQADINASLVDNNGTDKTGYVINAITGVIQTNTLDAAYAAGVNAYQGE